MPFGGGGALHTGAMLKEVGIGSAIVPRYPGVTSAMGCVIADMRQDFVQTINATTNALDTEDMRTVMQGHVDDGLALLQAAQSRFEARDTVFELDMAYIGQTHTVSVPLPVEVVDGRVTPPTIEEVEAAFDAAYQATYGRLLKNGMRRVMNLRTAVIGRATQVRSQNTCPGRWGCRGSKNWQPQGAFRKRLARNRNLRPTGPSCWFCHSRAGHPGAT